jgi:hypothetical protein
MPSQLQMLQFMLAHGLRENFDGDVYQILTPGEHPLTYRTPKLRAKNCYIPCVWSRYGLFRTEEVRHMHTLEQFRQVAWDSLADENRKSRGRLLFQLSESEEEFPLQFDAAPRMDDFEF